MVMSIYEKNILGQFKIANNKQTIFHSNSWSIISAYYYVILKISLLNLTCTYGHNLEKFLCTGTQGPFKPRIVNLSFCKLSHVEVYTQVQNYCIWNIIESSPSYEMKQFMKLKWQVNTSLKSFQHVG